jgi:curved DNA-binding protein CbpA
MGDRRSFYEILGVDPSASTEEIREAFRRLARQEHPDRYMGAERARAEARFQAITEAYNVLSDPEKKTRYDEASSAGASAPPLGPKEVARALLGKAVAAMKAGDAQRAEELFKQAAAHAPDNARAHHLYGVFLIGQPGRLEEGLRCLDLAAKLDPLNVRVLMDASRSFARAGMFARASRLARAAAQLTPGDEAVESWLRQLEEERSANERGR